MNFFYLISGSFLEFFVFQGNILKKKSINCENVFIQIEISAHQILYLFF